MDTITRMRAVMARLRVELRTRWRSWAVLALFVGFAGGVVLTTAAGARRTASAYTRFLRASHGADVVVSPDQTGFPRLYAALKRVPGATVTPVIGYGAAPVGSSNDGFLLQTSPDPRLGTLLERPKVTAGRLPRASEPFEVLADRTSARHLNLHPGSRLRVHISRSQEEHPSRHDPVVTLRVVGVGVTRDNVVSVNALASAPIMLGTSAFTRRFGPDHYAFDGAMVTLEPGTSKAAFSAAAQSLARRFPETGGNLSIADEADQVAQVNHAIRPQAVALALFAALTALAALFAIGQLLARQVFLVSVDNGTLRALGMSRRQLMVAGLAPVGAPAILGAIVAVVIAVAASPTMPIGPARVAEPHPGVSFDAPVLGLGFVAIVLLSLLCAAAPAWRYAGGTDDARLRRGLVRRPSIARRWATAAGAPPTMAIGIGHAIEPGRGRSAVPSRSAIAVTAMAIASIAAAATFATNLSRLVHTPRLYGQSWDVTIDSQFSPLPAAKIDSLLRSLPGVNAWTYGIHTIVNVDRQIVPAVALVARRNGLIAPTVVSGRAAVRPNEVVFGAKTLEHIHRRVGQTVTASLPNPGTAAPQAQQLRIVGRSVFPFFGMGSFTPTGLGAGAQVTEPMPARDEAAVHHHRARPRCAGRVIRIGSRRRVPRFRARAHLRPPKPVRDDHDEPADRHSQLLTHPGDARCAGCGARAPRDRRGREPARHFDSPPPSRPRDPQDPGHRAARYLGDRRVAGDDTRGCRPARRTPDRHCDRPGDLVGLCLRSSASHAIRGHRSSQSCSRSRSHW